MGDISMGEKLFRTLDYEIPEALQQFVMAVVQGETSTVVKTRLPAPATGFPLLIYVYKEYPKLNILGKSFVPTTVPLNVAGQIDISGIHMEVDGVFGQIGLIMHPLAPYYLFHIPGYEIKNGWKGLLEALPKDSKKHFVSISKEMRPVEIIAIILGALEELAKCRIEPIAWLDYTLGEIFRLNGLISLSEHSDNANLSDRHFRRKFKEIVGISPKYFCKVIQLNSVFNIIKSGEEEKLRTLALDFGYYDQAHFTNDFNKLVGKSPGDFLNGEFVHLKSYLGRNRL